MHTPAEVIRDRYVYIAHTTVQTSEDISVDLDLAHSQSINIIKISIRSGSGTLAGVNSFTGSGC